jgi:hypothetical protein
MDELKYKKLTYAALGILGAFLGLIFGTFGPFGFFIGVIITIYLSWQFAKNELIFKTWMAWMLI